MGQALIRLHDWPERLNEAIEAARQAPFAFGQHDCSLFAADCILAMTGQDLAADDRGTYQTEQAAAKRLVRSGGLEAIVTVRLGPPVSPLLAQRGDVVLTEGEKGAALGICLGARCAFVGPDGLVFLPITTMLKAWHV